VSDEERNAEIAGHTDSDGDEERNLRLSSARAHGVRAWLIEWGIAPEQLIARGYGEPRPVAEDRTDDGGSRNRQVEARLWSE